MILKIICFLLILRAGLVNSVSIYYNPTPKLNDHRITFQVDKCAESGIIKNCTSGRPYCFVDGDDIRCGRTDKVGWRISPLDGLVLNNGQIPNPFCTLFIPPEKPDTIKLIEELLLNSVYGSTFGDIDSAWFNMFEYLGNCPWKSQFCDKDTLTCQGLFDAGNNCNSSNQCFSHYCEKYGNNETDRRCAGESGKNNTSDTKESKGSKEPVGVGMNSGLSEEQVKVLSIVITVSVCSAMLLSGLAVCLILQRKKRFSLSRNNGSINSLFPNYMSSNNNNLTFNQSNIISRRLSRLSSLHSSFLSRTSTNRSRSSKYYRRDTSDHLSVLLPPPPTLSRGSSLRIHPYYNCNNNRSFDDINNRDSFDIYLPPQQYQLDNNNSFQMSY